jgi:hypothetical protein
MHCFAANQPEQKFEYLLVSKSHQTLHYPKLILYLKKALFEDEQ